MRDTGSTQSRTLRERRQRADLAAWPIALVLVVAGLTAYATSFQGMMLLDDYQAIGLNKSIQSLWPIIDTLKPPRESPLAGRPLVNFTFALNYAISGIRLWGYHAVNLGVHLAAGLLLWGDFAADVAPCCRTPLHRRQRAAGVADFRPPGPEWLAAAAALIWIVHPLQTESVTYLVQRTESLMGLFYLLTVYCTLRGDPDERTPGHDLVRRRGGRPARWVWPARRSWLRRR